MSGLIIGSSGIQLPSRIHRTRNRAGEQKGRSRGARGMEGDGSLQLVSMVGEERGGIWFNVPMMLLSEADNRHGWHKGTVVKFQLTKSDPENRAGSSNCNRGSSFSFLFFFYTGFSIFIYLFIPRRRWKYSTLVIQKKRSEKFIYVKYS